VYAFGWIQHPVWLKKGQNEFLFRVSRGRVRARLVDPESAVMLTERDMTLPDLLEGGTPPLPGAVRVINATFETLGDLNVQCKVGDGEPLTSKLPVIGPMTSRKAGFLIPGDGSWASVKAPVTVTVTRGEGQRKETLYSIDFELDIRSKSAHHKRTFISDIDGSVQYYALSPGDIAGEEKPALFLTLHGAGVEAMGQARCYAAKNWGHVVAATNRRPYGFDWEDWGRLDALEVLNLAEKTFGTDPKRTYLTGHSMGGHGTWHVGVTFPGRFAAIGPSAGWYSFWSYAGKKKNEDAASVEALIARSCNPSDTVALSRNFLHHGVYILHGEMDDNVPVTQARFMRQLLGGFHTDFAYYERPGVKHWWGNACCDWPPMFDFFRHHTVPDNKDVNSVEFITANPGISSKSRWAAIEAQINHLAFSSIKISRRVKEREFTGTTKNVARLALELGQLEAGDKVTVELDGQKLEGIETPEGMERLWLEHDGDGWKAAAEPDPGLKGPHRYGTFKDAFRHRMLFVYGTRGNPEENAWSYNKARFDAETFWYRGNGSVDVVADKDFDPGAEPDRNVIVYGNGDTNRAWTALLGECPVQVSRNKMNIGGRAFEGGDLGCYFIRPRPGSDMASVGVVAGTGVEGMKAANANMYFISGSGFPDLLAFRTVMLDAHYDGVVAAGYFGIDWSVENGEFAFGEDGGE
jgi:hypothetical protein